MADGSRSNITRSVEWTLWAQAGGQFINPDCNQEIISVGTNSQITAVFEIANITHTTKVALSKIPRRCACRSR